MDKAIIVNNVSKRYKLYENSKERLFDLFMPGQHGEDFYALQNVDFTAKAGEVVGFIGINGSGKSTLSNIIAGIVPETSGDVIVNGQASLIAVSAGLKRDLTGRDNIELKLLMLGFSKKEIEELEPSIIEFAELEKFIDQPVKSYSSGMRSRLGFAISVSVDPDILIIDEALSVGDKAFAEKSLNKMKEFKEQGKTMIFVSHSIGQMKKFCDKILWLEFGRVKEYGTVEKVIPKYESFLKAWRKLSKKERDEYRKNIENKKENIIEKKMYEFRTKVDKTYKERPISRLARLHPKDSYIYKDPKNLKDRKSSEPFKKSVYYVKKQVKYKKELFYLLSREPSAQRGVVGWMKSKDVGSFMHVKIDEDRKQMELKGTGSAYEHPWGGKKDLVYKKLHRYEGKLFHIERTDRVGRRFWHYGSLKGKKVWINQRYLVDENE